MNFFLRIILGVGVCLAWAQTGNAQGNNQCPRGVNIMVHASKDIGEEHKDLVGDPSFTKQTFLKHFRRLYSSPRLRLDGRDKPEYALTVTFLKLKGRWGSRDRSLLAIVFSFIGGNIPDHDSFRSGGDFTDDHFYFSGVELLVVTSEAQGHDPASHVPIIEKKLQAQKRLDDIILAYEQVPISVQVNGKPWWCDHDFSSPYEVRFSSLKAAVPPLDKRAYAYAHVVRFVAKAQRGFIANGDFLKEDHMAKVFAVSASNLSEAILEIQYMPPEGSDKSDVLTLYNSCEIRYEHIVPLNETKKQTKLAEIKVKCGEEPPVAWRWSGTLGIEVLDRGDCSISEKTKSGTETFDEHEADERKATITLNSVELDLEGFAGDGIKVREGGSLTGSLKIDLRSRTEQKTRLTYQLSTTRGELLVPLSSENISILLSRDAKSMEAEIEELGKKAGAGDLKALEKLNQMLTGEGKQSDKLIVGVTIGTDREISVEMNDLREVTDEDGQVHRDQRSSSARVGTAGLAIDFPATLVRDPRGRHTISATTSKPEKRPYGSARKCPDRITTYIGSLHLTRHPKGEEPKQK